MAFDIKGMGHCSMCSGIEQLLDALFRQVASDEFLAWQLSELAHDFFSNADPEVQALLTRVIHQHRVKAMEGRARIAALKGGREKP
ncbi:hypothetical protein [Methylobacterium sp. E-045]|uniref:hypothetical protein n=1 Tax=Methylobacterium sp. E-045 TaxID=2836575 RepID=UPI001FB8D968|nr:hypothetical protein [Methylobacterium sp. E-045]MCJ2132438.1 hypothetical protein [Methylobacterium sp. E-045]